MIKIVFTPTAINSLVEISEFLKKQSLSIPFVKNYLLKIKATTKKLLEISPESGVNITIVERFYRRVIVEGYSCLYQYENGKVYVLLFFREKEPKI